MIISDSPSKVLKKFHTNYCISHEEAIHQSLMVLQATLPAAGTESPENTEKKMGNYQCIYQDKTHVVHMRLLNWIKRHLEELKGVFLPYIPIPFKCKMLPSSL